MSGTALITGGNGFIAKEVIRLITSRNQSARIATRRPPRRADFPPGVELAMVRDVGPQTPWSEVLSGVEVVIHLAGRAHILNDTSPDPLESFRSVNTLGTLKLARDSASAGVKRFIFVSSIGVNGTKTTGQPFSEADTPQPVGAYAVSKWEAEQALMELQVETGIEVVIVRPPLVYGPGAPGNLRRLLDLLARGIPLPLAQVDNRRSYIGIQNLASLILCCAGHPLAAGQTFLAADGKDISTPLLIRLLAKGLGCRPRLWPFPVSALRAAAEFAGKAETFNSLCGSLQVDATKAASLLGWTPSGETETNMSLCAGPHHNPTAHPPVEQ